MRSRISMATRRPTMNNERCTKHRGIGHVDEITDNGQRITDKTEIVGGELSEEQFKGDEICGMARQKGARSRITLPD